MATEKSPGQTLQALPIGSFVTLTKVKPMGALQARKQTTGAIVFYWRYSIGTSSERVSLGLYDAGAPPKSLTATKSGYSLAAATRAAETMALEHHQHRGEGGRPALLAARDDAKRAAAEAKRLAATHTLENLLNAYCDNLEAIGRRSHSDARGIFRNHITEAWPKVAAMPAKDVTSEQFADMMRKLMEAGKGRTANKLRSYARAAYQTAKAAKSKPSIPVAFKAYDITVNPVADTEPDESQNRADRNPVTVAELQTYWQAIQHYPGFKGSLLRLHALTGGQRIEQLVHLLTTNISADSIVLFDGKGLPGRAPRPHTVPLTKPAAKTLAELTQKGELSTEPVGIYALSTDGGRTHVAATSLSAWAVEAVGDQIPNFLAKRIRSGVETLLASAGVSKEIRGRLQSHGISGVQARHYDGHDYMIEKRKALETLYKLLQQPAASNVTPIKQRKKA